MPHKGASGPAMTPPSFLLKNIILGMQLLRSCTPTPYLENVPTSLPATALELERGLQGWVLPHRLHWMPCVAQRIVPPSPPTPKKPMELGPSRFPRETWTPPSSLACMVTPVPSVLIPHPN